MMRISLIRHGRSMLKNNEKMSLYEYNNWLTDYDNAGVLQEVSYHSETVEIVEKANIFITSDLKRSIESALLLNANEKIISDPLFRETGLPNAFPKIANLKLSPTSWTVILRCLWLMGYSSGCESLRDARIRAKNAAERLVNVAKEYEYVVLVGHGFFNMLIAKELQKIGLKGKRRTSSQHWKVTTYTY